MRIAAIDCGTNSFHLLVTEVTADGRLVVLERARVQVMLGSGGIGAHKIAADAFARGLDALRSFAATAARLDVLDIHAAATSAVREAKNGAEFCDTVKRETGIHLRVISGLDEGRLIWLGARGELDHRHGPVMLMDLGGGSTEFVLCDRDGMRHVQSLALGHIRSSDAHADALHDDDDLRALRRQVRAALEPLLRRVRPADVGGLVATSGTARTLARMTTLQAGGVLPAHDQGLVLERKELEKLIDKLRASPDRTPAGVRAWLSALPGMDMKRADTLLAGAVIIREALRAFSLDRLTTSERSLRDGLVVEWITRHRPELELERSVADPRERTVMLALQRFGADEAHARHVAALADTLFDATAPLHQLPVSDRGLLHAAAMLHDIGHHIAGESHHKHGQYLLKHIPLPGFTAPDAAILGNVVRYHSRSQPKASHTDWVLLDKDAQQRVRVLAGLLKVADALDRGHHQGVREVVVSVGKKRVTVEAVVTEDGAGDLERWEAERRVDLLEKALGREVRLGVVTEHAARSAK